MLYIYLQSPVVFRKLLLVSRFHYFSHTWGRCLDGVKSQVTMAVELKPEPSWSQFLPVALDTLQVVTKYLSQLLDQWREQGFEGKRAVNYYTELGTDMLVLGLTLLQYLQLIVSGDEGEGFRWQGTFWRSTSGCMAYRLVLSISFYFLTSEVF